MSDKLLTILLSLSAILGVEKTPIDSNWKVKENWQVKNGISIFSAELENQKNICAKGATLTFPMLVHGAHEIYVDGKLFKSFGDPTFKQAHSFYQKPYIQCDEIVGNKMEWHVYSYAQYFARFKTYPHVTTEKPNKIRLLYEIFNIISGTGLILLCFITSIIFFRKINNKLFFANICANLGFATYFIFTSCNYFSIDISMLAAHKIADTGVWMGILSFSYILYNLRLFSNISFKLITFLSLTACLIIISATTGDTIQFGTSLPFPILILSLIEATYKSFKRLRKDFISNISRTSSVLFFFFSGLYEIAIVVGIVESNPMLSVGILGALIAVTLIVQSGITSTYKQRDELLNKLESKVEERTYELKQALKEKEIAQAELIQNAKLASLGTLSAGIAHEINNNINYVNACIVGIEKEFSKIKIDNPEKIDKLIKTVKHGTSMTIDIVNSLRNYTGLNQAKTKNIKFGEITSSVKNIIRRKIDNINIIEEHDETYINCNVVGLNQVVMNLLTNAIDAVDKDHGIIKITSKKNDQFLEIKITDNGHGIPKNIIDKIFDPFFTTKDVGSGTGLGLHIVRKEIEAHGGTIKVISETGKGTTFVIRLPINNQDQVAA